MTIHRTSNYIRVEGCVLGLDIGEAFELFKIDPNHWVCHIGAYSDREGYHEAKTYRILYGILRAIVENSGFVEQRTLSTETIEEYRRVIYKEATK
jgi:hypothetical protein